MFTKHVESTFCDDIRTEVGGKLSFMGVYTGSMSVPQFPITLPKFAIHVKTIWPVSETVGHLAIKVMKGDKVIREASPDVRRLAETQVLAMKKGGEIKLYSNAVAMVFSPFNIEKQCTIRICAFIDGKEYRAAALRIAESTQTEQNA